ncbi:Metallo-dependent phosphatase [Dacryopinax primogenitus]|uniref:Metallo-dependent phosphatase n=1 Tax=Dacryopinax primogenitus (strain DJM 731) TaxID=1858805 RepID=M5GD09_DACPD|nr:Metallo-dependent phosphatase [Dacryopinax primogenitus]EJU04167.1 Metallo-dependent phosphatase [Dacryopinax primogenitus]
MLRERRIPRWRRAGAIDVLRASWIIIILWGELGKFYASVSWCSWPDRAFRYVDAHNRPTRILIVSDPQILDRRSYPGRPWVLTRLTQFIVDLNLRKNWRATLRMRPQIVVFLGDMMDGGRYAKDPDEYARYFARFQSIFSMPSSILSYYIPGNHDVGLGYNQAFSSRARERYQKHFGALNQVLEVSNHSLVLIDAPGLVEEDYRRYSAQTDFASWLPTAGGSIEFVQSIKQSMSKQPFERTTKLTTASDPILEPTILFSHIPLSRPEGANCGPRREKGTIHRGAGIGYQNLLGRETTQFLLESIKPDLIFSGDDHDACEYLHTLPASTGKTAVREVTVKSFSMAMGVKRPGFQLLSIAPPPAAPRHGESQCLLPDQIGIYTRTYLPLFIISLLILAYMHIFNGRKGATVLDEEEQHFLRPAHQHRSRHHDLTSILPGYAPQSFGKLTAKLSSRTVSPVSTPLPDTEEFALAPLNGHNTRSSIDLELADYGDGLSTPGTASKPTSLRRGSGYTRWVGKEKDELSLSDPHSWPTLLSSLLAAYAPRIFPRNRRKASPESMSRLERFLRDLWRAAWPPLLFTILLWTYLFWT